MPGVRLKCNLCYLASIPHALCFTVVYVDLQDMIMYDQDENLRNRKAPSGKEQYGRNWILERRRIQLSGEDGIYA